MQRTELARHLGYIEPRQLVLTLKPKQWRMCDNVLLVLDQEGQDG